MVKKCGFEIHVRGGTDDTRHCVDVVGDREGDVKNGSQVAGLSFWKLVVPLIGWRYNGEGCFIRARKIKDCFSFDMFAMGCLWDFQVETVNTSWIYVSHVIYERSRLVV